MTAMEAMERAEVAWRERRARVEKLVLPVRRRGETLWWSYSVPMRHGSLGGWRASQPEALHACLDLIHEAESKGWK